MEMSDRKDRTFFIYALVYGIVKLTIFAKNAVLWQRIKNYGYRTFSRNAEH